MSVEFYLSKTRRLTNTKKCWTFGDVDFGFKVSKDHAKSNSLGYHAFNVARARIISSFDNKLGLAWHCAAWTDTNEINEIMDRFDSLIPKSVFRLVMQPDCDGLLTAKQVVRLAADLCEIGYCAFKPIQFCKFETLPLASSNHEITTDIAAYNAHYIVSGIFYAAKNNLNFIWF